MLVGSEYSETLMIQLMWGRVRLWLCCFCGRWLPLLLVSSLSADIFVSPTLFAKVCVCVMRRDADGGCAFLNEVQPTTGQILIGRTVSNKITSAVLVSKKVAKKEM